MPTKSLLTKGIFAVGVVAVTATAGVVSFAQAANGNRLGADNGYGGSGAIQAAIQAFQDSVHAAAAKFNNDINACLTNAQADAASANSFRGRSNANINNFSSKFATTGQIDRDQGKMQQKLNLAADDQDHGQAAAETQLYANLDRTNAVHAASHRGELQRCLAAARQDFRQSVRQAEQTLLQAIRDAIGSPGQGQGHHNWHWGWIWPWHWHWHW
jgi:hypothetical protein